ncbi:MAG: hypothetical protein M3475_02320 [Actinomycetota bacterium]|nr:hypothetical protein [Actinomycetota bacterium]
MSASNQRGKRSEEITTELDVGACFVKVSGFEGAWDGEGPYKLKIDRLK